MAPLIVWIRRLSLTVVLAAAVAAGAGDAHAQKGSLEEVQAAFLYQFGRYVEWPADLPLEADSFPICVLGTDPFGHTIDDTTRDKSIEGLAVSVRRLDSVNAAQGCRIVFVSASEEARWPAILMTLHGSGALTVGEGAQFARLGGMIAFTRQDRTLKFVVNETATAAAGLRLSSQLLRLAVNASRR